MGGKQQKKKKTLTRRSYCTQEEFKENYTQSNDCVPGYSFSGCWAAVTRNESMIYSEGRRRDDASQAQGALGGPQVLAGSFVHGVGADVDLHEDVQQDPRTARWVRCDQLENAMQREGWGWNRGGGAAGRPPPLPHITKAQASCLRSHGVMLKNMEHMIFAVV